MRAGTASHTNSSLSGLTSTCTKSSHKLEIFRACKKRDFCSYPASRLNFALQTLLQLFFQMEKSSRCEGWVLKSSSTRNLKHNLPPTYLYSVQLRSGVIVTKPPSSVRALPLQKQHPAMGCSFVSIHYSFCTMFMICIVWFNATEDKGPSVLSNRIKTWLLTLTL